MDPFQATVYDFVVEHVPGKKNGAADAISRTIPESQIEPPPPVDFHLTEKNRRVIGEMVHFFEETDQKTDEADVLVTARAQARKEVKYSETVPVSRKPAQDWRVQVVGNRSGVHFEKDKKRVTLGPELASDELREIATTLKNFGADAVALTKQECNDHRRVVKVFQDAELTILVIPTVRELYEVDERNTALEEAHILPTASHAGTTRMYITLRSYYYWPGMYQEVQRYVSQCRTCK